MPEPSTEIHGLTLTTTAELARFLEENARGARRPLVPVGGGTALDYGYPVRGDALPVSLGRMTRVIDYPAADMTVTVEAGLSVGELAGILAEQNQQLPIDVPQAVRATVGGILACDVSGPRRFGHGTLRDALIGVTAVDGTGRVFHAGGRVVKNVAGYDLCKLLVGPLGTLAVITEATFKLRPLPETACYLWAAFADATAAAAALARLGQSAARPTAIELLNRPAAERIGGESALDLPGSPACLALRVEGAGADVTWQVERLREELADAAVITLIGDGRAAALDRALTEFELPGESSESRPTFRANLVPSQIGRFFTGRAERPWSLKAHAADGIVIGHFPADCAEVEQAAKLLEELRRDARAGHGGVSLLSCPHEWKSTLPVFDIPAGPAALMRRVRRTFDPHHVLNPGRLFPEADDSTDENL